MVEKTERKKVSELIKGMSVRANLDMSTEVTKHLDLEVAFAGIEGQPEDLRREMPVKYKFNKDFLWAVATASYQIEGSVNEDGKGESIWDRFCLTEGSVKNGDHGEVACDHYRRYPEDVELMKLMNLGAYRFSISWPRVIPQGIGKVNAKGLDFYSRLVDMLLEAKIRPFVTLYHWDLPQALQDRGGWANRQTAEAFGDYAEVIFKKLGDRVKDWITINEASCVALGGYAEGWNAPGIKGDCGAAFQASHNLNVAHGLAIRRLRAIWPDARIGTALNLSLHKPADSSEESLKATKLCNDLHTYWWLDPLFTGRYPESIMRILQKENLVFETEKGDEELIREKTDFTGLNYYCPWLISANGDMPLINVGIAKSGFLPITTFPHTIYPEGLYEIIEEVSNRYGPMPIYITENGYPVEETPDENEFVRDDFRTFLLREHLVQVHRAIEKGFDVRGYFLWTLYDNFEWAHGYSQKFGIVRLNPKTLDRVVKKSGLWYSALAHNGGFI